MLFIFFTKMFIRNIIVLLFTVILTANGALLPNINLSPEDLMKFISASRECRMANNIDISLLARAMEGEIMNNRNFDCYAACVMKKTNLMNQDDTINVEFAISKVPNNSQYHDQLVDAIRTCSNRRGNDACGTAHELLVCFHEMKIPGLLMSA